ncbi:AUXIN-RESPONSIVE FAMILY PROTEIN [Salix viminalis]|uniref:AUXIN-RESPONSIVE FAMILY PROTEIN n=1 Tax=Salix viminalis TaxID=40686 RepID=A0A9Q0TBX5_SALVM|nr:AUXIN-RESPONSIVE FAMILY PROTEIN [Salix viminalis]
MNVDDNNPSFVAEKGHWKRFAVPLAYLGNEIFHELFKMSEEEFGISSDRPITLPGDSEYMDYILSLIQRGEATDFEKILTLPLPHDSTAQYLLHQIMNMLKAQFSSSRNQWLLLDRQLGHVRPIVLIFQSIELQLSPNHQEWIHMPILKMITAKKLIKLARKWQKLAAIRRRRLTLPQTISSLDSDDCGSSSAAEKGHFVVYTTDKKRFVLPLNYLNNEILRELFNLAEEEFGLTSDGPITLPCDATFMEYAITLIQQNVAKDIEKALLITIASNRCPSSLYLHHDVRYHRLSICT